MIEYAKALTSLVLRHKKVLNQPITVNVDTSNVCNLRCKMCFRNESYFKEAEKQFLTVKTLEKLFSQIKPEIILFGGISAEPLMNKEIGKLVGIATRNKAKSIITTNGLILNEKLAYELLKNDLYLLKFSVDAATKETYKKIRNSDNFDKLIDTIKLVNRIKKDLNIKRDLIRLDFVVQNDNLDDVIPFIYLAKELGINFISYIPVHFRHFTEETKKNFRENYDLVKIVDVLTKAKTLSSRIGIKSDLSDLLSGVQKIGSPRDYILKDFDYYLPWFKYTRGRDFLCTFPWLYLAVYINGDVSICCTTFSERYIEKALVLGNIHKDNLWDIWNGKTLQKIRELFLTLENVELFNICKGCHHKLNIWHEIKMNDLLRLKR